MSKIFLLLSFSLLPFSFALAQDTLLHWEFAGQTGGGINPLMPTTQASHISTGGLQKGTGVVYNASLAQNAWGGRGFNVSTMSIADTSGKYIYFHVKPNAGYQISLKKIAKYSVRKSGTGPSLGQWQYSLDDINFTNIDSQITWITTTSTLGNQHDSIDLSLITALQNISNTNITIRLLIWGASGASGTWYLNNTFTLIGKEEPLSVKTFNFSGTTKESSNLLKWSPIMGRDNTTKHFELQKSNDGKNFAVIQKINVNKHKETYYYEDYNPLHNCYYRLKSVSTENINNYSEVVAIRRMKKENEHADVYPNPTKDRLYIRSKNATIRGYRITGTGGQVLNQLSLQTMPSSITEINTENLNPGIYFLELIDDMGITNYTSTFTIIK